MVENKFQIDFPLFQKVPDTSKDCVLGLLTPFFVFNVSFERLNGKCFIYFEVFPIVKTENRLKKGDGQ